MTDPAARNLPNPFQLLAQQFRIEWRLYVRDRGAMFWTFLFPLLMLFGMGMIFRSGGAPSLTLVRVARARQLIVKDASMKRMEACSFSMKSRISIQWPKRCSCAH